LSLLHERLRNQHLSAPGLRTPAVAVSWFGAMQAQDYAGAKWAIGIRVPGSTDKDVDAAFDAGAILRTHVLRPTWHVVTPDDIRWMLALTAPRVHAFNAPYYRRFALDRVVLARLRKSIERALTREPFLTRDEIRATCGPAGAALDGIALGLVMMHAELEGVVCSGPRRGRQFTYALLDRRAPHGTRRDRDDALGELARRYFRSHGPATLRDFAWWSGLTQRDGRRGIDVAGSLSSDTIDGLTYWRAASARPLPRPSSSVFLLPNYDECLIAYQDRGLSAPASGAMPRRAANDRFAHHLLIDGRVAGSWGRSIGSRSADIDIACYAPANATRTRAIERAARKYGRFLGKPIRTRFRA
jgi:hypothetical protein